MSLAPVFVPNAGEQWTDVDHTVWRLRSQDFSWREIANVINTRQGPDVDENGDPIQWRLPDDHEEFMPWHRLQYRYEAQLRNLPDMEDTLARRREIMLRNDTRRSRLSRIARDTTEDVEVRLAADRELGKIDEREARLLGLNAPTRVKLEVDPPSLDEVERRIDQLAASREAALADLEVIEATSKPAKKKPAKTTNRKSKT